jgi:RNA polymerase sigma-70 factor (ECF subfamily)
MASESVRSPPSLEQVFERELDFVWRSLRWSGIREADREDLVQEVFLIVHKQLPTYEERGSLRAWLFSIVRRVAAGHRRRAHHLREEVSAAPPEGVTSDEPSIEARGELARLQRVLSEIDPTQADVFVLYEIEALTMPEIATLTDSPLQTCYSRLHAARARVVRAFEGEHP